MSDALMVLDVAVGYFVGRVLWELALAGAHHAGRLSVRMVMKMARQTTNLKVETLEPTNEA